tara:strand:- start:395 stop:850 length:456 start_codon:yes stop_codon:yes gene_type:complete
MFKVYKNILTKDQQKNLLNFVKNKVKKIGPKYPGLQSNNNLHTYKELNIFLEKIKKYIDTNNILGCWVNYTNGDHISWHNHPSKYSLVYYLHNKDNVGVMFRNMSNMNYYLIEYTEGLENSMVVFDSSRIHSVPNSSKKLDRYTLVMDLNG